MSKQYSVKIISDPKSPNGHWQFARESKEHALRRAKHYNDRTIHSVMIFGLEDGQILASWNNGVYLVGTSETSGLYNALKGENK